MKVVIVGGGWAGCAAAVIASKHGAEVTILERTDMLLGTGLVGGIMRNNGRFTAAEEMIAMGAGELFILIDQNSPFQNINLPAHKNAYIYNAIKIEDIVRSYLQKLGVVVKYQSRMIDVNLSGSQIISVKVNNCSSDNDISGDAFIDATGSGGPMANCRKYGNGCAMCILRCPTFGGRVSLSEKSGIKEIPLISSGEIGGMSGSCKLVKDSLSKEIVSELNKKGVVIVPIPEKLKNNSNITQLLKSKSCQQYTHPAYKDNIILINTGMAKMMMPYFPLHMLRQIRGFENVRYEDPYAGSVGNSIRYVSAPPRDNKLKVRDIYNLFCAGEKAGACIGHTEAICTGSLAGYNAVQLLRNENLLTIPDKLAVGNFISYSNEQMQKSDKSGIKCTFSGSVYFEHMKTNELYLTDAEMIRKKVAALGMSNIMK